MSSTKPSTAAREQVAAKRTLKRKASEMLVQTTASVDYKSDEYFLSHAAACNRALNHSHEPCAPKFTAAERSSHAASVDDYGGITGTINPSHVYRVVRELEKHDALRIIPNESVFCDIGCGMGRPTLYWACLPLKASIGFDIDPLQIFSAVAAWGRVQERSREANTQLKLNSPVALFRGDAMKLRTLGPTTHAYAFIGYTSLVRSIALLAARSLELKVLIVVVLRAKEVEETQLYLPDMDEDVVCLQGMQMPAGNRYTGYILPMTPARKKRVLKALRDEIVPAEEVDLVLDDIVRACVEDPDRLRTELIRKGLEGLGNERPKRRSSEAASKLIENVRAMNSKTRATSEVTEVIKLGRAKRRQVLAASA